MTTKLKISLGFVIMVVFMGILAVLGYRGLGTSSDSFEEYRRLARLNVLTSDMTTEMGQIAGNIFNFTTSDETQYLNTARENIKQFHLFSDEAETYIHQPERKKIIVQVDAGIAELEKIITTIEEEVKNISALYNDKVRPLSIDMTKALTSIGDMTIRVGNNYASSLILKAMGQLGTVRSATSRFSQSRDQKDSDRSVEVVAQLEEIVGRVAKAVNAPEVRSQFAQLSEQLKATKASVDDMAVQSKAFQATLDLLDKTQTQVNATLIELSQAVNDDMRAQGAATIASNSNLQKITMGVSAAGLVLAVLLAAICIIGIVRVLQELGVFAGAIASGNFNYDVKIREKGEVGQMVAAMREIPAELNRILDEYKNLELQVQNGDLAAEGNAGRFHGDFATLVRGTNAVLSRFRLVLENIPSPVVMLDGDLKAAYLNTVAKQIAGDDFRGKNCQQLFAREDYGTDACSLKKAVESKNSSTAETRAHPRGKEMDISYTV
ncbi:hypothetical protein LJC46_09940, partial [Desulfovibrio sp. OttesenSCG-928-G15]|nr:hypothetical protein [Desulfovibrio sp. OttesenSCG-928-G15]